MPLIPSRKKRSFHLYPVLALIPYSSQSARKLSVPIAFNANSIRPSIGSIFFHGISGHLLSLPCPCSVTYVLNLLFYLCSEPGPATKSDSVPARAHRCGFKCRVVFWLRYLFAHRCENLPNRALAKMISDERWN